jgi:hypothetical protein
MVDEAKNNAKMELKCKNSSDFTYRKTYPRAPMQGNIILQYKETIRLLKQTTKSVKFDFLKDPTKIKIVEKNKTKNALSEFLKIVAF